MSETGERVGTLEGALWLHRFNKGRGLCACGAEMGGKGDRTKAHRAHVAAEVRAWLAGVLAGERLREAVADHLCRGTGAGVCFNYDPGVKGGCSRCDLDAAAALTAVRDHLETAVGGGESEE